MSSDSEPPEGFRTSRDELGRAEPVLPHAIEPGGSFGACPVPHAETERILLAHGSGGLLTSQLVEQLVLPAFDNPALAALDDQAILPGTGEGRLAFTTDSYVVTPLFFPGGDIGELAVNGTINDLAVGGARPIALSLAFILEEGLDLAELRRVIASARAASLRAGVPVVTGDTKVVGRGSGDKIFINTSGVGVVPAGVALSSRRVCAGDAILLSGTVGDHGATILAQREGLGLGGDLRSDTAALHELCAALLAAAPDAHAMRDPTRGGLAGVMV
jgi:hydrogenase expression/formation protein HypE